MPSRLQEGSARKRLHPPRIQIRGLKIWRERTEPRSSSIGSAAQIDTPASHEAVERRVQGASPSFRIGAPAMSA
jgi:hypothetical protein